MKFAYEASVARTLVSAASRLVSTLRGSMHRDESRCGSLKAAPLPAADEGLCE